MIPRARRLAVAAALLAGLYVGLTAFQVWWVARSDGSSTSQAIVVLGAAQYDGQPSPVLAARLDHAFDLWEMGIAPVVVVTGGSREGDRFTEARAGADYLLARGVPDASILREVAGTSSWESMAAVARFLRSRRIESVTIVSDPYHSLRLRGIAREVGLAATVSPARSGSTSPRDLARETLAVAAGQLVGHRRLTAWAS